MLKSESVTQGKKFELCTITARQSRSIIGREPSFSRWFTEDSEARPDLGEENNNDRSIDDSNFQLPLLHQSVLKVGRCEMERCEEGECKLRSPRSNGLKRKEINGDDVSLHVESHVHEKHMPFSIENPSKMESKLSDIEGVDLDSHGMQSHVNLKNSVSTAIVLKALFFILVWYSFSTFLTLYNKSLLGDDMGKFPAPLLMNTAHFALQAVLSKAITWLWSERFQPNVVMSWSDYFIRVVPTALGTAFDVNLSNASLVFISVTFATMCKSASPIFLLLFAFAFRLETPSIKLLGIILTISIGVLLTVAKETEFDLWGFIFVMLAAVMSGFRWSMTQILLQKEIYGLKNPFTLMSHVAPVMTIATGLLSLLLDPWHEFKSSNYFNNSLHIARSCSLMLFGGALAFFMVLTEYILVSVTSAVTVTIAGVVKEAVTILVAVLYFHDEFTWLKAAGLFTIMVGVGLFNWYKYQKMQNAQSCEDSVEGSFASNAPKYVILDMGGHDDP